MVLATKFRGYRWDPPAGLSHCVLNATEVVKITDRITETLNQPYWVLDYCFDGSCLVKVNSESGDQTKWEKRPARVGHLYMPGTLYTEDTRVKDAVTHSCYLCFHLDNPEILMPLTNNPKKYARILDPENLVASKILKLVDIGITQGDEGFWQAQAEFCELINMLLKTKRIDRYTVEANSLFEANKMSDLVTKVRVYLRANVARTVKLEEIADYSGVSVSTLTHAYKNETGETPMITHEQLRISQIRSLLLKGEPLKVIASMLGFSDIYHLSKYFKRSVGVSPKKFLTETKSKKRNESNVQADEMKTR